MALEEIFGQIARKQLIDTSPGALFVTDVDL
jgi:hypothetical protein